MVCCCNVDVNVRYKCGPANDCANLCSNEHTHPLNLVFLAVTIPNAHCSNLPDSAGQQIVNAYHSKFQFYSSVNTQLSV
jgi:hypothetical protein